MVVERQCMEEVVVRLDPGWDGQSKLLKLG